jgi:hypothetical protein
LLEPVAIKLFCEENGYSENEIETQVPVQHGFYKFFKGTADLFTQQKNNKPSFIGEVKCKGANTPWENVLYNYSYHLQAESYMYLKGVSTWKLIVFNAETAEIRVLEREEIQETLPLYSIICEKAVEYFENYILQPNEPDRLAVGSEACKNCPYKWECMGIEVENCMNSNIKDKKKREYKEIKGSGSLYVTLKEVREQIKQLEENEKQIKADLYALIGNEPYISDDGVEFSAQVQNSKSTIDYNGFLVSKGIDPEEIPESFITRNFARVIR